MSKQENDKDEPRTPSGTGKGDAASDASQASAKDDSASPPLTPDAGKGASDGVSDKSGAATQGASQAGDKDKSSDAKSSNSGKSAPQAQKPASQAAKPGQGKPEQGKPDQRATGGPSSSNDKGPGKAEPGKPGSGSSASGKPPAGAADGDATKRSGGGGKSGGIALVLVVLLALIVVIGGWWGWQQLTAQQQRLSQAESNAKAIGQLKSQLAEREKTGDQQREQALQGMRDEFKQYRESVDQTLDKVLKQLASEQKTDPSDWQYAEVEYLLRLANQRLQLERDVAGAEALLHSADERLVQADNPALTAVRRAIQSELAALGSVPDVDRTGLYLTLMAQQEQLARLPLKQDIEQIAAKGGDTSPVKGTWRDQLARFGQELKDLVVVRKHDQALEALMTPDQESYLRQNVRLQLEQAQLALLQANPKLYQASLEKAASLIKGYYDTDNQGVSGSLEKLTALADKTIRPELPDISDSLQNLRDFMERRRDAGSAGA